MGGPRWTPEEMNYVELNWPKLGSRAVSERIGRSSQCVQKMAQKLSLKCDQKSRYERHGRILSSKTESCNIHYFSGDWSANMAYIVGYIFADGCIRDQYTLSFLCHSKDEEILLGIYKELECTNNIRRNPAQFIGNRNNGPRTSFNATSKILVQTLKDRFGLVPNKTTKNLPLPEIPDSMFGHFFRGYFDGDGCVSFRNRDKGGSITITGTETFIRQMRDRVCQITGVLRTKIQEQTSYSGNKVHLASWGCQQDLKKTHGLVYPKGSYLNLARKREKFDRLVAIKMRSVRSVCIDQ